MALFCASDTWLKYYSDGADLDRAALTDKVTSLTELHKLGDSEICEN